MPAQLSGPVIMFRNLNMPLVYATALGLALYHASFSVHLAYHFYSVRLSETPATYPNTAFAEFAMSLPAWVSVILHAYWLCLFLSILALLARAALAIVFIGMAFALRVVLFARSNPVFDEAVNRQTILDEFLPIAIFTAGMIAIIAAWRMGDLPRGWPRNSLAQSQL